jgi:hypothetical protein
MAYCIGCEGEGAPGWPDGSSPETWDNMVIGQLLCVRCAQVLVRHIIDGGRLEPGEYIDVLHRAQCAAWMSTADRLDERAAQARAKAGQRTLMTFRCEYTPGGPCCVRSGHTTVQVEKGGE